MQASSMLAITSFEASSRFSTIFCHTSQRLANVQPANMYKIPM